MSGIYRGPGGTGDATQDASSEASLIRDLAAQVVIDAAAADAAKVAAQAAQTAAETAETNAETAETNAETAETNAELAETNAEAAQAAAEAAQLAAETAQTAAELAETNAETAETNATASANLANDWATKTSGFVAGGEYSAKYNANLAATSALAAQTAETNAATAQTAAEAARDAALASLDSFDDRYLGSKSVEPTLDNDGNALVSGALYFNTVSNTMKVYTGTIWVDAYADGNTFLAKANNLSDLINTATARTNLGLGTIATQNANNVSLTGGSISGITDLAVADGGTGASTSSDARTNLGVAIGTDVQAYSSELQAISNGGGNAMFKNRIINGAMMIDQRNAGASVTIPVTTTTYTVDRWNGYATQASKFTVQQSTTVPTGFVNSLVCTSSSAYSVTASDYFVLNQRVEGLNMSDLAWGTASASAVTLSFWVRSSLTGTFGGAIQNSAQDRSYPFSFTISSANTYEYKTITIAGDTSGTWLTTNGIGMRVFFNLGSGSTYSGTANAWAGTAYFAPTGATSVVGTNGATFYITGVQLEKGSTATSFDYRPYGTELALCQRYYYRISGGTQFTAYAVGGATSSTVGTYTVFFPVQMRATPTIGYSDLIQTDNANYLPAVTGTITGNLNSNGGRLNATSASGLTQYRPQSLAANSTSSFLEFPAEL